LIKKVLFILILILIVGLISLATIFKTKPVLIRIADKGSLFYVEFYGAGDFVIKNPFRDKTFDRVLEKIVGKIAKMKNGKYDTNLEDVFELNSGLADKYDIVLGRASKEPGKYLKSYSIRDIIRQRNEIVYVLDFHPDGGKGCLVINRITKKGIKFWVNF
jgi:hypothetical protein